MSTSLSVVCPATPIIHADEGGYVFHAVGKLRVHCRAGREFFLRVREVVFDKAASDVVRVQGDFQFVGKGGRSGKVGAVFRDKRHVIAAKLSGLYRGLGVSSVRRDREPLSQVRLDSCLGALVLNAGDVFVRAEKARSRIIEELVLYVRGIDGEGGASVFRNRVGYPRLVRGGLFRLKKRYGA